MTPRSSGALALAATVALDQSSKLLLLFGLDLPVRPPIEIGPVLDLVSVWNRGISYGLFQQGSDAGRWILVGVSVLATLALAAWMMSAASRLLAVALGLVAGGAAGNAIDRAAYGAVFDFVHLHVGPHSWYVFNVADAAIVAGVVGLLVDAALTSRRPAVASGAKRSHDRPNGSRGRRGEARVRAE